MLNPFEEAIVRNAHWFVAREDPSGFIEVPADEYYGITGMRTIGDAVSVRTMGWALSGDAELIESAKRSAAWLAERQDAQGGWHHDAGFSLDAAQCAFEGFCTYERMTGTTAITTSWCERRTGWSLGRSTRTATCRSSI